jgi:hypothetical protein
LAIGGIRCVFRFSRRDFRASVIAFLPRAETFSVAYKVVP